MTSTMREREEWTAADIGEAMAAHQAAHARVRRRGDGLESRAFHREGADNAASLCVWPARGAWADARSGRKGGGREYAAIVAGCTLPELMARYGRASGGQRRALAPAPALRLNLGFPPAGEVAALWEIGIAGDLLEARAAGWMRSRKGLDPVRIVDAGVLRALPADARAPGWARQAGYSWPAAFAVVTRLFDAHGVARSLHARRTLEDPLLSKTSSPAGYTTKGLVMADELGRALLAGGATARGQVVRVSRETQRPAVVIVEGLPAFAAWASDASDADEDAPAVIGILSGGWTAEHAARLPDGARVLVDVDPDKAGDAYRAQIASTFTGRNVELLRAEVA